MKTRKKNLATARIDYKKAFDMVTNSWILQSPKMFGINEQVRKLRNDIIKNWRVELTSGSTVQEEASIRRGIFQGYSLSPLLFVIAPIPLTDQPPYQFSSVGERTHRIVCGI